MFTVQIEHPIRDFGSDQAGPSPRIIFIAS